MRLVFASTMTLPKPFSLHRNCARAYVRTFIVRFQQANRGHSLLTGSLSTLTPCPKTGQTSPLMAQGLPDVSCTLSIGTVLNPDLKSHQTSDPGRPTAR
jgi:hypothetical protein